MGCRKRRDKRVSHTYKQKPISIKKKPSITLGLFCWVFRKNMIKLTLYNGEERYSYASTGCYCGKLHSYSYWSTKVGDCILNKDGTVDRNSDSVYMAKWEYVKR